MAFDSAGYVNYFMTSNLRSFNFRGRYETGGSPAPMIDGVENENRITAIHDYGSFGFFIQFKNHFTYSRHMQLSPEYSSVCIAGSAVEDKNEPGIKQVAADQGI